MKRVLLLMLAICVMAGCSANGEAIALAERDPNVFKIGYYQGQGYQLDNFVQDFINEMDPEVEVVLETYEGHDFETFKDRLYNSFLTGTEPDVIICGPQLDIPFLASKGYLKDLSATSIFDNVSPEFFDAENPYFVMNSAVTALLFNSTGIDEQDRIDQALNVDEFFAYATAFKEKYPDWHVLLGGDSEFTATNYLTVSEVPSIKKLLINDLFISDLPYLLDNTTELTDRLTKLKTLFSPENYKYQVGIEQIYNNPEVIGNAYNNVGINTTIYSDIAIGKFFDNTGNYNYYPLARPHGSYSGTSYKYGDYIIMSNQTLLPQIAESFMNHYMKVGPFDDYSVDQYWLLAAEKGRQEVIQANIKMNPNMNVALEDYRTDWELFQKQNAFYFETTVNKLVHEQINQMLDEKRDPQMVTTEILNKVALYEKENQ
ncbi:MULTISPECIES: ABC transporter substrate-binding protein [unclassified Fusibacter]|uniref:ABC transporter substrate-binding protein n=1 Tax=unclassified Fusibacter TaxID=2624464 RepID=UPI0010111598|nr:MULTISPECIES: ABC transporter substrate-binding protein [unclassified Fusibacter]MCK8059364.1 ABC transporter substrate-binding protein [Fusibacter sp. A2]NPE21172.1 hypothetical protein [Fusibacter sp. A1]RXV62440.1 hypothetical protein DWB64_05000 [Fusibacter sp. A1]